MWGNILLIVAKVIASMGALVVVSFFVVMPYLIWQELKGDSDD